VADRQITGAGAIDLLPFEDGFEALAPLYIRWLHEAEAEGWALKASEIPLRAELPLEGDGGADPILIRGRLDRVDRRTVGATEQARMRDEGEGAEETDATGGPQGLDGVAGLDAPRACGERLRLIDYKLRSVSAVARQAGLGSEDTQLAFYAALALAQASPPPGGIEAGYLALDDREAPSWKPHPNVQDSARALVQGLVHDVSRLRAGAALPALGDGEACQYCAARGLCRRDHWERA
jgi:ATP-dependent helicase/nuclease subunit B